MSLEPNRSFDGGCFLFTCGCLSGGCLGAVIVAAIATGLFIYGLQIGFVGHPSSYAYIHIQGDEMSPTLKDGDWVLVERGDFETMEIRRGDLVWIEPPEEARRTGRLILRVAGLPGETVSFGQGGELLIQGEIRSEEPFQGKNYTKGKDPLEPTTLGERDYYLLGDEPSLAKDSRNWGPIQTKYFRGTVRSIIFPPNRLKSIEN